MSSLKSINFGIDLGTTNSSISKFENGRVTVFKNPLGLKETMASAVAYRKDRIILGDKARELLKVDPFNVFTGFKRRMGTDQKYYVVNLDENVTPIDLSSQVLKELKQFVHSGEKINAAVITVPASFDTMQSNATIKAGNLAGINDVVLLQEPIAASLAYFNNQNIKNQEGNWLVYDLGGGTFDVALVQIKDGELKVADHEGNNFLGGTDIDQEIIDLIVIPQLQKEFDLPDLSTELKHKDGKYESLYYELLYRTEEAKKELSFVKETTINFQIKVDKEVKNIELSIFREDLEKLLQPIINQTIHQLKKIIERNNLVTNDINEILLVGGSTYIPLVKENLKATGIPVNSQLDPTTAVTIGAAYYAANKLYKVTEEPLSDLSFDDVFNNIVNKQDTIESLPLEILLNYSKMSKDLEEVVIAKVIGDIDGYSYRINRVDGGFDSGIVPLKQKFTEFLPLIIGVNNIFQIKFYNSAQVEVKSLAQEISIIQGQFNINGQPIAHDICLELDDKENKTTKLEVVFEKNSVLPQQKSLYRQISKTILKDSDDFIIINISEGDRNARPLSNLIIGEIKISGKEISSDLIKGSDIELKVIMTDSRELQVSVYLVMTQQEFKNVFSVSEKHINLTRLREQFIDLEQEIRQSIRMFSIEHDDIWSLQAHQYLQELDRFKLDILQLSEKDNTDKKFIVAETVRRISQEYDKLGGEERIHNLINKYLEIKEQAEQYLLMVDFNKEELKQEFGRICKYEASIFLSKNPARIEKAIYLINNFAYKSKMNNTSNLIAKFEEFKGYRPEVYSNYKGAQIIFIEAQRALEAEKFFEFRQLIYNLTNLFVTYDFSPLNDDYKGTGIG